MNCFQFSLVRFSQFSLPLPVRGLPVQALQTGVQKADRSIFKLSFCKDLILCNTICLIVNSDNRLNPYCKPICGIYVTQVPFSNIYPSLNPTKLHEITQLRDSLNYYRIHPIAFEN